MSDFLRRVDLRRFLGRAPRRSADERPYFEATLLFQAADMDEAERLFELMTDALGCSEDCHAAPCPYFRFGSVFKIDEDGRS